MIKLRGAVHWLDARVYGQRIWETLGTIDQVEAMRRSAATSPGYE